ncbi:multidrug effflux MFS transporter [Roseovarius aestuarii]|uniref:Bicyclomycin resistance protein n=1 Tax=Roseovarius aestuarii TaxID=475083 RepID=A0A1X7BYI0_9RHOB|nr:multidrug effflux MFS transporter [Roseovarius aestuarii]SMC14632.1 Bicyclomycin resistance protein [Roseovarius aestuarii]
MGKVEFVSLMAMLGGVVAYSIDAMLPALPSIGAEFSPDAINRAQLVVTSFVFGMGLGTFFVGPLSDAFGRKRIILIGTAIFALATVLALVAPSLNLLVAARVLQGLGVSAARIVSMAIIRDLYAGREMARLMSFVTMVFTLVPAVAPLIGSGIIAIAGWRGVFGSFLIFAAIFSLWMSLRLAEPLPREHRRPFRADALWLAVKEVLSHKTVVISIAVQTLCLGALFASLSSIQQIMGDTYDRAAQFPYWFGMTALIAGGVSLLNAALVLRYGMRQLVSVALTTQVALCLLALTLLHLELPPQIDFSVYVIWQASVFAMVALTLGNLTSLAMEPLGHIAGMAASVTSGLATVGSVLLAVPIGLWFNGSALPLVIGVLICATLGRVLMIVLNRIEKVLQRV